MDSGLKTLPPSSPVKPKSPWGVPAEPQQTTCSLATVMDEELARKLQSEEDGLSRWVWHPSVSFIQDKRPSICDLLTSNFSRAGYLLVNVIPIGPPTRVKMMVKGLVWSKGQGILSYPKSQADMGVVKEDFQ